VHAAREGVLFTYSSLLCNDSGLFKAAGEAVAAGKNPMESMKASGFKPDMKKRGSVRTVFDGRYKFSRYFAPVDRNRPATLEDLYKVNEVELFDLQSDPSETVNLATDKEKNRDLILAMSAKLEAAIRAEIGVDDGREMPEIPNISWAVDRADL
jgi:arylsulfatase